MTRSSKSGVQGIWEDGLKVSLKSPPVDGKANRELIDVLSKAFGRPKKNIEIVRGFTGRNKVVLIIGAKEKDLKGWQ